MKLTRSLLALALTFSLSLFSFLTLPVQAVHAQDSRVALQRGYRTGYSDGYMAGYRDAIDSASRNFARHNEYADARRAYNKDYGPLEDYRDGYQQGFEYGYDTGFEKRSFDAVIPSGLQARGVVDVNSIQTAQAEQAEEDEEEAEDEELAETPASSGTTYTAAYTPNGNYTATTETAPAAASTEVVRNAAYQTQPDAVIIIPRDTELILELDDDLTTAENREGDKFTARVVSPSEIAGAIIEGRIDKIQKPGRIKRRSAMLLSFDRIVISENRWSNFDAIMTEVLPIKGDNIRRVDDEGTAIGSSTIKNDSIKVGAATGTGAGIGAVAGGPVGAAVGAGIGAAFGVGAVIVERGKHIRLNRSQQLRIKTSYDVKIR